MDLKFIIACILLGAITIILVVDIILLVRLI